MDAGLQLNGIHGESTILATFRLGNGLFTDKEVNLHALDDVPKAVHNNTFERHLNGPFEMLQHWSSHIYPRRRLG